MGVAKTTVIIAAAIVLARLTAYSAVKYLRAARVLDGERAIIVGTAGDADYLFDRLGSYPRYGLRVVARIPTSREFPQSPDAFLEEVRNHGQIGTIVFAHGSAYETSVLQLVRLSTALGYRTYFVPRFQEIAGASHATDSVWGVPLVRVRRPGSWYQRTAKRAFDIVVSGVALLVAAPLMAVIALAITRETKGGMLFRQQRVGQWGRRFDLLKFQTMVPATENESQTQWNIAADQRLGPIGRFLRKTSLDELPQFINVIRGDMSLVGPRPERPVYVEQFSKQYDHYSDRHRVPVGLTGWAQIHRLRGDTSIDDRARFDNAYVDRWSLWEDTKIVLRTIPEVIRSSGG